jgi:hypothetical protein
MRSEQLKELRPSRPITTPTDRMRSLKGLTPTGFASTLSYFHKALPYAQNRRELPNGEKPDQPPPGQPHPPFWA